jgi:hypothetical protein
MRISVWQQFSSNHSGSYTVVGVFDTPEAARNAHTILQNMMHEIDTYSRQNKHDSWTPNAIEVQYEQMYSIQWHEPIDWLTPFSSAVFRVPFQRRIDEHVLFFDRVVFVDSPAILTWQTGHQFSDLMQAMGADTYSRVYEGTSPDGEPFYAGVTLRLDCLAPTDAVAEEVYHVLARHLENRSLTPWYIYHPRFDPLMEGSNLNTEQLQAVHEAADLWHILNSQIISYEEPVNRTTMPPHHPVLGFIEDIRGQVSMDGTLTRTGRHILLHNTDGGRDLIHALPALGIWLQKKGCVITYQFEQVE